MSGSRAREHAAGSLSRQASIIMLARSVAFVVSFAIPIVLVRVIDTEQYGHYRQAVFLLALFSPILQFGMTQSLYYFYTREAAERRGLMSQTVLFLGATAALFAAALLAFPAVLGWHFKDPFMTRLAPFVAPYVGLMVVASILDVLPVVQQNMRLAFWVIVGSESLRATLLVGTAVITRDVAAMILALAAFAAVRALFLLGLLRAQGLLGPAAIDRAAFRRQLGYAVPFGLAGVVVTLILKTDQLYISRYFDATRFGIYSVGCFQLPIVMIVFQSAASVMLGRMAALQAESRTAEMRALVRNAVRKLALVALPAVALSLVLARDIITVIYTDAYVEAVPIFMIFLALIPRAATAYGTVTRAFGLTRWIFKVTLVALVVALGLVFILTPRVGLLGPALAVVTALWVVAGAQIWMSGRLLGCGLSGLYPWPELAQIAGVAAALAAALWAGRAALALPPVVYVLGGGALYGAAFVLVAVTSGMIRPGELAAARHELRRRLGGLRGRRAHV